MSPIRIVAISDTHGKHDQIKLPAGDILIHAGDMTMSGTAAQVKSFGEWFSAQTQFKHRVAICGNHDFAFENPWLMAQAQKSLGDVIYLESNEATVMGLRIWGSPVSPFFHDWAWNRYRGEQIAAEWAKIPEGIDILVTHGPPMGILDKTSRGELVGCQDLLDRIQTIRPRLHIFGHIHEAYGQIVQNGTQFINASTCNLQYQPVNPPIVWSCPKP